MTMKILPKAPTPQDFERIGRQAARRLSRREAEMLLGEPLRTDVPEYRITDAGRDLRVEYFAEAPMTLPFWVVWFPDGNGVSIFDWRGVVHFEREEG
jgi:hypothetical protein